MSKVSFLSFGRYLVIATAVVLLAPYAGCHILTSPPNHLGGGTIANVSDKDSKRAGKSADEVESSDGDAATNDEGSVEQEATKPKLSEIESLLREP